MRPVKYIPHAYQKRAIKFLLELAYAMLLLSPGLGKTSIVCAAIKILKARGEFKGALVLAPLRPVYSVWPNEVAKWEDFKGLSAGILHGKRKEEVLKEAHDLYLMNYEGIEWLFGEKKPAPPRSSRSSAPGLWERYDIIFSAWQAQEVECARRRKILFSKVDVLVADELSKMKHCESKRFQSLKPYLHKFARRWGLTGSPASNGLQDLFGQVFTIDLGKALGQYVTHFRNRFFYPTGYGGYTWSLQEGAAEKIYAAIKPLALTMQAEDYLDLPKLIPVTVYIDLPADARKVYEKMEDELFTELDGKMFLAATAASASIKCEQIANGALYDDKVDPLTGLPINGKRGWSVVHKAKLDALSDILDELQGQPSLWGYHFHHDLERIVQLLGKDTPHCDHSPKIVDSIFKKWNRNELPYLFGHPASVGHGNNLQEGDCSHVGFFSVPWDYDIYSQFIQRIKRQGNKSKTVFLYHIVAKNTVDEAKMAVLHNKARGQQDLLDALKTYRKNKLTA